MSIADKDFNPTCRREIVPGLVLTFAWWGGEYIEVGHGATPAEVINVWNAGTDEPRIARTVEAFEAKVDDWIEEYGREALAHDARVNW